MSAARRLLRKRRTVITDTSKNPPTIHMPVRESPVKSSSHPVRYPASRPDEAPKVLTTAMPTAAPAPERKIEGRYQNTGSTQKTPIAVNEMTAIVAKGAFMYIATGILTAARSMGRTTCQIRSPVRSECLVQSTIAIAPQANGTATIMPVSKRENWVLKVVASPFTIVGRKKLSAKRP